MTTTATDIVNSLLRGEISAAETYNQAMEKFASQPEVAELRRLRDAHRDTANTLRQHVHKHGDQPATSSGLWGTWAKFVEGTAKVFGKAAALKALKEGEDHGVKQYQRALDDKDLAADCKTLIRTQLLPQAQGHIPALDRLMSAQSHS
jgi:uncharacterized protein (TIGR02284 family)